MQRVPSDARIDREVRQRINRFLSTPIKDREWEKLANDAYLDDIRGAVESNDGAVTIDEFAQGVAGQLTSWRHVYEDEDVPQSHPQQPSRTENLLAEARIGKELSRRSTVSHAIRRLAGKDADVAAFVQEVLGGHWLTEGQTSRDWIDPAVWIERQWRRERQAQAQGWETATEMETETDMVIEREMAMDGQELPSLVYAPLPYTLVSDWGRWVPEPIRTLPVTPGGTLDRLRLLANRLSVRYCWEPAEAVTFLLMGFMPSVSILRAQVDWNEDHPMVSRITLTIDPATPPAEVADAYGRVRAQIARAFPREKDVKARFKARFLALEALDSPAHMPLERLMEQWNMLWFEDGEKPADDDPYRSWWYDDPQKFGRDRRRALQHLLRPKYSRPPDELLHGIEIDEEYKRKDDQNRRHRRHTRRRQ